MRGAAPGAVKGAQISARADVHAHNTFAQPNAVGSRTAAAPRADGVLVHRFPAASVTRLQFALA